MLANAPRRRRHQRTVIDVENLSCRFQLKLAERTFESIVIRDVSAAGLGFELGESIAVDTDINITLIAGEWCHGLQARVIWCQRVCDSQGEPLQPRRYRMGLRFDPANAHNNILFYMAARTVVENAS